MQRDAMSYCDSFDLIFIDGDHRYEGVKRLRELPPAALRSRRHLVSRHRPDHVFKGATGGGDAWKFWADISEGSKTTL
jgi:hypothetical protein